jgi:hypothetical protein
VSRHSHRSARPAACAETPPMNANDCSLPISGEPRHVPTSGRTEAEDGVALRATGGQAEVRRCVTQ